MRLIDGIRFRGPNRNPAAGHARRVRPLGPVVRPVPSPAAGGTRQQIFATLRARADAKHLIIWDVKLDSTVCRAAQQPPGREMEDFQKEPPGGVQAEPTDHGLGVRAEG
ncbi:hypothetical protein LO772_31745 [Yinghuangia sp. ASG 101]|uniref:hypothetical protein n=1 Tax=Yinghuangia sp. ASG 101 TaxID=2896848 RepID=UPI001E3837BB|nr:hypothetical protein [Yinghuangia sp. ASG 101]UGQ11320.1 hypothetical protein LO772_31745 [Yinghuangia sp. ASG 101]